MFSVYVFAFVAIVGYGLTFQKNKEEKLEDNTKAIGNLADEIYKIRTKI